MGATVNAIDVDWYSYLISHQLEEARDARTRFEKLAGIEKTADGDARAILLKEAQAADDATFDIFLSHAWDDAAIGTHVDGRDVLTLKRLLEHNGFSVYADWSEDDQKLARRASDLATAQQIRMRIRGCALLVCAVSPATYGSQWVSWEVGYADAALEGRVAVLEYFRKRPQPGGLRRHEFLALYRWIEFDERGAGGAAGVFTVQPSPGGLQTLEVLVASGRKARGLFLETSVSRRSR